ncbi:FMN-binding protein [Martelella lutilitoris]|uniref:Na(+)-translocating NADH-quinone reductase subunit C n=1 Tax=Martelella lutilitoris TaxID=2583532 RepID=A0A5C4JX55_9HYPH|nr:FMN-binding protein [Martelella lutilitoris]TNB49905.1 FMN-binding protein [Martelella lutilitoris]
MADLNPFSAWRRFLALPNENRTKTVVIAFLVSAVCALMVSGATVILRPIQAANRAAEEQARLEALVAGIPGMTQILEQSGGSLSTVVINLPKGQAAQDVTPATLAAALDDAANWTTLTPAEDTAGIGRRPDYAQIYLLRNEAGDISLALLPISGPGYQAPIDAIVALRGDMNTIAGLTITNQAETPGLGGRIEEPAWLAQFPGTELADPTGTVRFAVAKGAAGNDYEVDGITGATRTGNAFTKIMRFWGGPEGYGPFIDAVQRGEF